MTELRYVGLPQPLLKAALAELPAWPVLGERMLAESKRECPVGKSTELDANYGKPHSGKHLKDTMEVRFETGVDPRILIGSTLTRDENVSALGLILEGTVAHEIRAVNAKALRFTSSSGTTVFAAVVQHPGTKRNEFVQRAIRTVVLETVVI